MISKVLKVASILEFILGVTASVLLSIPIFLLGDEPLWAIGIGIIAGGIIVFFASACMLYGFAVVVEFCENNMNLSYYAQKLQKNDNVGSSRGYQKDLTPIFKDELPDL